MDNPRIYFTGTGGQGTLTATRLLAHAALDAGIEVVASEVHGMAQRGGVVESALLMGGWRSPRLDYGEADILVGFEALETLRGLPYLNQHGFVFSSTEMLPPLSVTLGQAEYPPLDQIEKETAQACVKSYFLPCQKLGEEAGNSKSANTALLGALCASGLLPVALNSLLAAIDKYLPARIRAVNIKAAELGAAWFKQP